MQMSALFLNRCGRSRRDTWPSLSTFGKMMAMMVKTASASAAMHMNVALQPSSRPIVLPRGIPIIIATDVPAVMMLSAVLLCPSGAMRTARGVAMDQNTAWEQATPRRDIISML